VCLAILAVPESRKGLFVVDYKTGEQRLFVTTGGLIKLGDPYMEGDNKIVILKGASYSMLVRSKTLTAGSVTLVGPAKMPYLDIPAMLVNGSVFEEFEIR
jgi:hypothetical protein